MAAAVLIPFIGIHADSVRAPLPLTSISAAVFTESRIRAGVTGSHVTKAFATLFAKMLFIFRVLYAHSTRAHGLLRAAFLAKSTVFTHIRFAGADSTSIADMRIPITVLYAYLTRGTPVFL